MKDNNKIKEEISATYDLISNLGKVGPLSQMTDAQIKDLRYRDFMKKNGYSVSDDLESNAFVKE